MNTNQCTVFNRNIPGNGFSRVKVDRTDIKMKQILSKMVKKRGLKKAGSSFWNFRYFDPPVSKFAEMFESISEVCFCINE